MGEGAGVGIWVSWDVVPNEKVQVFSDLLGNKSARQVLNGRDHKGSKGYGSCVGEVELE